MKMLIIELTLTTVLHRSEKNNFSKRHKLRKLDLERKNFPHLAEDQPEVDHLWVGGQGKLLHHANEDGGHHQHVGQVDGEGGLEEERLEEGGGEGDHQKQKGRQKSAHHFAQDFSLQNNGHPNALCWIRFISKAQTPFVQFKQSHVPILFHQKIFWKEK